MWSDLWMGVVYPSLVIGMVIKSRLVVSGVPMGRGVVVMMMVRHDAVSLN